MENYSVKKIWMIPAVLMIVAIVTVMATAYYTTTVTVTATGADLTTFDDMTPTSITFVKGTEASQDLGNLFNVTVIHDDFDATGQLAYRIILFDTQQYRDDFKYLYLNVTATPYNATGTACTGLSGYWNLLSLSEGEVILEPHWTGETMEYVTISATAYWFAYNEGSSSQDLTLFLEVEQAAASS